jgi:hypothetical protein
MAGAPNLARAATISGYSPPAVGPAAQPLGALLKRRLHNRARCRLSSPDLELGDSLLQQHLRAMNDRAALRFCLP